MDLTLHAGSQPFVIGADRDNTAAKLGFYLRDPHGCVHYVGARRQGAWVSILDGSARVGRAAGCDGDVQSERIDIGRVTVVFRSSRRADHDSGRPTTREATGGYGGELLRLPGSESLTLTGARL